MKKATIVFAGKTEMPNVWENDTDYVENCSSVLEAIEVLKKYYTENDMKLIISIEIK